MSTTAPQHLDPVAAAKWQEVIELLQNRGDELDSGVLDSVACYAAAWSRLVEAETKLRELGTVIRTAAGAGVSPYAAVQKDAARQLRQFGQALRLDKSRQGRKAAEPESAVTHILRTMDSEEGEPAAKPRRRKAAS
jgi:phage terminase small subunit